MATQWSIQYLLPSGAWSGPVLFADAQISGAVRKLVNQGIDTCQITFGGTARPPNVGPLAAGTVVRVLRDDFDGKNAQNQPDGSSNPCGWFVGTVVAPKRTLVGNSESAVLLLNGPWWYFTAIVYRQQGLFYVPVGTTVLSGDVVISDPGVTAPEVSFGQVHVELSTEPYLMLSSDIILTQAQAEGIPMDAAATLQDALAYASAKGARFTVGAVPANQDIPSQTATDPTCADMVKKVLRWLPSVVSWFDYTTDPPTLNFQARADRPAITLQMGGDVPQVQQATLQARPDLVLPGVTLQYLRRLSLVSVVETTTTAASVATVATPNPVPVVVSTQTNPSTNSGYQTVVQPAATTTDAAGNTSTTTTTESTTSVNCLEVDTAGPDPDGIGALVATVQLQGGDVQKTGINTTPFEPTPQKLAAFIFAARSVLSYEGTVQAKGQDLLNLGNPLGRTLNIAGGDAEWTTMAAEIQTVTETTQTGATSLQLGPPNHLGPSDLAALLQANRLRQYVDLGTILLRNNGGAALPPANPLPPTPPPGTVPPGNPGKYGPSNGPDGGTETEFGFSGILTPFSGSATTHAEDGQYYTTNAEGSINANSGIDPTFGSVGASAPETSQGGQASGFYATMNGMGTCGPQYDVPPANVTCHWETSTTNTWTHSEGNLDLTGFSALHYKYAELRGTHSYSQADGSTATEDYTEDCTARLGTRSWYRVYASGGIPYKTAAGGFPAKGVSASIFIAKLYLVPRTN